MDNLFNILLPIEILTLIHQLILVEYTGYYSVKKFLYICQQRLVTYQHKNCESIKYFKLKLECIFSLELPRQFVNSIQLIQFMYNFNNKIRTTPLQSYSLTEPQFAEDVEEYHQRWAKIIQKEQSATQCLIMLSENQPIKDEHSLHEEQLQSKLQVSPWSNIMISLQTLQKEEVTRSKTSMFLPPCGKKYRTNRINPLKVRNMKENKQNKQNTAIAADKDSSNMNIGVHRNKNSISTLGKYQQVAGQQKSCISQLTESVSLGKGNCVYVYYDESQEQEKTIESQKGRRNIRGSKQNQEALKIPCIAPILQRSNSKKTKRNDENEVNCLSSIDSNIPVNGRHGKTLSNDRNMKLRGHPNRKVSVTQFTAEGEQSLQDRVERERLKQKQNGKARKNNIIECTKLKNKILENIEKQALFKITKTSIPVEICKFNQKLLGKYSKYSQSKKNKNSLTTDNRKIEKDLNLCSLLHYRYQMPSSTTYHLT